MRVVEQVVDKHFRAAEERPASALKSPQTPVQKLGPCVPKSPALSADCPLVRSATTGYPFQFNMTGHLPKRNIVEHRLSAEGLSPGRARACTCHHYHVLDLHDALTLAVTMSTCPRKATAVLPPLPHAQWGNGTQKWTQRVSSFTGDAMYEQVLLH